MSENLKPGEDAKTRGIINHVQSYIEFQKHKVKIAAEHFKNGKLPVNSYTDEEYDYIIIGAGTAGCVLADRLASTRNFRVLIIEAGPCDAQVNDVVHAPIATANLWSNENYSSIIDWGYVTESQEYKSHYSDEKLTQHKVFWPRGKVWGGSSAVNRMIYIRGVPEDYNEWSRAGPEYAEWSYKNILPYFIKCEKNTNPDVDAKYHGFEGKYTVQNPTNPFPISLVIVEAAKNSLGLTKVQDFNKEILDGVGVIQVNLEDNKRNTSADHFLKETLARGGQLQPSGATLETGKLTYLNVVSDAMVKRIVFDENGGGKKRAIGVEYYWQDMLFNVKASKEIILCAGAINSPQILMLSGIGDPNELRSHGITPFINLPNIGKNLFDHPLGIVVATTDVPTLNTEGRYACNGTEAAAFIRTSSDKPAPDIQINIGPYLNSQYIKSNGPQNGFTLIPVLNRPKSRGCLKLKSNNPFDHVLIYPHYYELKEDMDAQIGGIRASLKIIQDPILKGAPFNIKNVTPLSDNPTDQEIEKYIRSSSGTSYHCSGTCKMGPHEDGGVVDHHLRVYQTQNVRVVDASIFPNIPSGNINAAIAAIAYKAGDFIAQESGNISI